VKTPTTAAKKTYPWVKTRLNLPNSYSENTNNGGATALKYARRY
jgi:hypothetical protein